MMGPPTWDESTRSTGQLTDMLNDLVRRDECSLAARKAFKAKYFIDRKEIIFVNKFLT